MFLHGYRKKINKGDFESQSVCLACNHEKIKTALNPGLNEGSQVGKSHLRAKNTFNKLLDPSVALT